MEVFLRRVEPRQDMIIWFAWPCNLVEGACSGDRYAHVEAIGAIIDS